MELVLELVLKSEKLKIPTATFVNDDGTEKELDPIRTNGAGFAHSEFVGVRYYFNDFTAKLMIYFEKNVAS